MLYFWTHFLYEPTLNVLIFLYDTIAHENLGVAIIILTVALRIVLLPFTIIAHRAHALYVSLDKKVISIRRDFKDDPILQKEQIRELLTKHKVNPWAKSVTIGIQILVLVLLYQVFLGGINRKFTDLYPWVYNPDFINTRFLGFELGHRNMLWAFAVAVFLYIEIVLEQRKRKNLLLESEVIYRYFFPLLSFFALYALPMAKSLFVLTSLLFSFIIEGVFSLFKSKISEEDEEE